MYRVNIRSVSVDVTRVPEPATEPWWRWLCRKKKSLHFGSNLLALCSLLLTSSKRKRSTVFKLRMPRFCRLLWDMTPLEKVFANQMQSRLHTGLQLAHKSLQAVRGYLVNANDKAHFSSDVIHACFAGWASV